MDATQVMEDLRRSIPAAFYKPNKPAPESLIERFGGTLGISRSRGDRPFFESLKTYRITTGGNRSGKTTKCVLETGAMATGCRPWYPPENLWYDAGIGKPSNGEYMRILVVLSSFVNKTADLMNELVKWWPKQYWKVTQRTQDGPRQIEWFTGAQIRFISHEIEKIDAEGTEADFIYFDEPPPSWLWDALTRGLVSTGGRAIVGATLLDKSEWFWDTILIKGESGDPSIDVFWHSIWDNCAENGGMPMQAGVNIAAWLDNIEDQENLRLAREHGHPVHVSGLVLSNYRLGALVDPFELPSDVIGIYSGIDPGGGKPIAAAWVAFLEGSAGIEAHLFDESWDRRSRNDLDYFAKDFLTRERGLSPEFHPVESTWTVIDPLANQPEKVDRAGRSMSRILDEEYGIRCVDADKANKKARLARVNAMLGRGELKVWKSCRRAQLEALKWSWDETAAKLTKGPDDIWDCVSYIESGGAFQDAGIVRNEDMPGVWMPEQYRSESQKDARRRARQRKEERVNARKANWRGVTGRV